MELVELEIDEALYYNLPVISGLNDTSSTWYGLSDENEMCGFMEVVTTLDEVAIDYLYVPEKYRGKGYAKFMVRSLVSLALSEDVPVRASFMYSGIYGEIFETIFRDNGFSVAIQRLNEIEIPFETAYNRLSNGKVLKDLSVKPLKDVDIDLLGEFWKRDEAAIDMVGRDDMTDADKDRSVIAINSEGKIVAALLVEGDTHPNICYISALWGCGDNPAILRSLFTGMVKILNAQEDRPTTIEFLCLNENIESLANRLFDTKKVNPIYLAEAEFDHSRFEFWQEFNANFAEV